MPHTQHRVYQPASLEKYTFQQRLTIRLAEIVFYCLIRIIGSTLRFEVRGMDRWQTIADAGHVPIYTFWHDDIFPGTYFWRDRGIVVMTSQSLDGEYIARFIRHFGFGAIRGSSSRGGSKALVDMIKTMREGLPMAFTADGPRGPRYIAKPGAVMLAKKTGNPIMPFVVVPQRRWLLGSWDRLQIPMPFTKTLVAIDDPIYVPRDATAEMIDKYAAQMQASLDALKMRAEAWRVQG